jgi:hypothetical protein
VAFWSIAVAPKGKGLDALCCAMAGMLCVSLALAMSSMMAEEGQERERKRLGLRRFDWDMRRQGKLVELADQEQLAMEALAIEQELAKRARGQSGEIWGAFRRVAPWATRKRKRAAGGVAAPNAASNASAGRPRRL